jgi:hypothetical protein
MSFKIILGHTIPAHIRLSKTEAKILDTITTKQSGNAYRLWKASGLKHYPTVLRTLKKLEQKRIVQALGESRVRGERIYTPTLRGTLISYIFKGNEKKIIEIVEKNSSLFRELYKVDKDDYWAFRAVEEFILGTYTGRESRNIDDCVKFRLDWVVSDTLMDILEKGKPEWIIKVSKVEWIRQRAIRHIEDQIDAWKKHLSELRKLQKRLISK